MTDSVDDMNNPEAGSGTKRAEPVRHRAVIRERTRPHEVCARQLHLDVRHRLTNRVAATFSYLYEPFRVYDFAFDPTVVNGMVQPSSLVLGYVYRPDTAHSGVLGL